MIRALLSVTICGLCVGLGLETARVQSENYACADRLDETKRRCDLLEAGADGLRFEIDTRLSEINFDDLQFGVEPKTTVDE